MKLKLDLRLFHLLAIIASGVWILLVFVVGLSVYDRAHGKPHALSVVAAKPLEKGRLLVDSDIRLKGLGGYVIREIKPGETILPADLTPNAGLNAPAGSVLTLLALDPGSGGAGVINSGAEVQLCQGSKAVLAAKVQTVICQGAAGCSAAIPIPADKASALKAATFVRAKAKGCS